MECTTEWMKQYYSEEARAIHGRRSADPGWAECHVRGSRELATSNELQDALRQRSRGVYLPGDGACKALVIVLPSNAGPRANEAIPAEVVSTEVIALWRPSRNILVPDLLLNPRHAFMDHA